MWFVCSFTLVSFMFLLSWLLGQSLLSACGFRLPVWKPESAALGGLLGAAILVLSSGYLSWLGFAMRGNGVTLTAGLAALAVLTLAWKSRRAHPLQRPVPGYRRLWPLVALLGVIGFVTYLGLLSLLRDNAFNPYSDAIVSVSLGEYLQDHSFRVPVQVRVQSPVFAATYMYQAYHLRMGAHFLLALVQSWVPFSRSIDVFPAVSTFGVILDLLAVFLCCRWMIRMPVFHSLCGCLFGFTGFCLAHYSADWGFMNQLYGIAFSYAGLTLAGFLKTASRIYCIRWVVPFGMVSAALVSAYNEMLPMYGMILIAAFGLRFFSSRNRHWRPFARLLLAAGLTAILANIELLRAWKNIAFQMHTVAGGNIDYTPLQFAGSWLGVYPAAGDLPYFREFAAGGALSWCFGALRVATGALAVYGLIRLVLKARWLRHAEYACALAVYSGLVVYFAYFVRNPFLPGQLGQTWNIYKLTIYSFPLGICAFIMAFRRMPCARPILLGMTLASWACSWPVHDFMSHQRTEFVRRLTRSQDRPFAAFEDFATTVNRRAGPSPVRLVIPATGCQHSQIAAYYLYPLPIASNEWRTAGCSLGNQEGAGFLSPQPPYPFTLVQDPPAHGEPLSSGFWLLQEPDSQPKQH